MGERADLEELLARAARRDRAAFAALYRATSAKLFGVVLRILASSAEAEEVLQVAYLKVWNHAERYSPARASPIAWMAAIARNAAIDRLRANASRGGAHEPVEDEGARAVEDARPSPEDAAIRAGEARLLRACLDELDERHAVAIRAAFLGGLTYREIGAAMSVPENTIKTWVRRSLARLRGCMNRGAENDGAKDNRARDSEAAS